MFDQWIFEDSKGAYSVLATNTCKENFKMYELTEGMRQKDNMEFAELLNRPREGNQTEDDIEILRGITLHVKPTQSTYPMNIPHLFSTNKAVDKHNRRIFNYAKSEKACISAIDVVIADLSDEVKECMQQKNPKDPTKTMGL